MKHFHKTFIYALGAGQGSDFMDSTQVAYNVFLITLIFVCIDCLTHQLKINRKYTTVKRWLDTKLRQIRTSLSRPLNDVFIAYLSLLIGGTQHLKINRKYIAKIRWLMTSVDCARHTS